MRCEALITLAITHTTIVRRRALCDGAPLEYALILLDRRPLCTVRCSSTCNVSLYIWELNQFYALLDRYRILDCTVETRSMMSWDKYSVYVKGPRAMIRKALTKPLAWARRRNNYTYRLRKNSQESLPLYSLFSMNSRDRSAVFIISIRPSLRLSVACNFDVDEDRPLADTPIQDLRLVKIGLHSILDDFDYRDIQYWITQAKPPETLGCISIENYSPSMHELGQIAGRVKRSDPHEEKNDTCMKDGTRPSTNSGECGGVPRFKGDSRNYVPRSLPWQEGKSFCSSSHLREVFKSDRARVSRVPEKYETDALASSWGYPKTKIWHKNELWDILIGYLSVRTNGNPQYTSLLSYPREPPSSLSPIAASMY
ncbi:hypothetical protein Tco_0730346 [Tanacetum coccineum]|uniref:Uncharacterized protein n=1 Tax=Tanacetum coccineum TaxID=301880 RepID=A0ABQ4YSG0_9ASTR